MSQQIRSAPDGNEGDAFLLRSMAKFVVALAASSYAPDWETMSENIERNIASIDFGNASLAFHDLVTTIKTDLPKIKQIIEAFYSTDKIKMLQGLEIAMDSVPV